jgi:hypothetical protein
MAAADHIASRLLDHLMNVNDVTGPWMPRIKDLTLFGPMGAASSRCTTDADHTRALTTGHPISISILLPVISGRTGAPSGNMLPFINEKLHLDKLDIIDC